MSTARFNILMGLLIALLIFFQYRLWSKEGGMKNVMQLKKTLAVQAAENQKLKKQNELLLLHIQRLQKNHDATESRARNELGMIKRDETFYQIIK